MTDVSLLDGEQLRGFVAKVVECDVLCAKQVSYINKSRHESCVVALSRHRIILYNIKTKRIEYNMSFLNLNSLTSGSSSTISLSTDKALIQLECTDIDGFIIQLFVLISISFPACELRSLTTYKILPEIREEKLISKVERRLETVNDMTLLETFRPAYEAFCDFYDINPDPSVVWTIERVYYVQNRKIFYLQDFDHLPSSQILATLSTIKYTGWFKGIQSKEKRLNGEILQKILTTCKTTPTVSTICLSGVGQIGDALELLNSPDLNITSLDLSENNLEFKETTILCNILYKLSGLQHLNLAGSKFSDRGLKMIAESLKQSCSSSLLSLTLDRCTNIKPEGWACFSDLLCHLVMLQELSLSETAIPLESIWTPLLHGCVGQIKKLNLSQTKFSANKNNSASSCSNKVNRFLVTAQDLNHIDLSGCKLPPDVLKLLISGISDNILLTEVHLNLSSCELGVSGIRQLASQLPSLTNVTSLILKSNEGEGELTTLLASLHGHKGVKHLDIGDNFNKLKDKSGFVKMLISLIENKESAIQSLNVSNLRLKSDLNPFLGCLAYNKKLRELDISGNGILNSGARVLAQSLSVNKTLRKIALDNNQLSLQGFKDLAAAFSLNTTLQSLVYPYQDIGSSSRSHEIASCINKMTSIVEKNNSPDIAGDDLLLHQQYFILNSSENLQLDKAVVNLYDNLTKAQGKRGEEFIKKKKEGLDLLKEAEKCYQLMHLLHEKADTHRTKIYTSAANSDVYRKTAKNVSDIVNEELTQLSSLYYNVIEKTVPKLMVNEDSKNSSQKYCENTCRISEDAVYGSLSKNFHHELTLIIGKCMLQAETKITTLIVDSMVTRLNELAKHVEELNSHKGSTSAAPKDAEKEEENEQEEEIDESIKQRRFTYTEKRKEIVRNDSPAARSSSVSSINKPKPSVPAKPTKRKSVDEESVVSSDREALVPTKPSSEADSESIKSEEKVEVEIKPSIEEKPVVKEKPATKEKPVIAQKPAIVEPPVIAEKPAEKPETPEITDKPEVKPAEEVKPQDEPEPAAEKDVEVETKPEEKVEPEKEPEKEPEVVVEEKPAEEPEKTEEVKDEPTKEAPIEDKPETPAVEVDAGAPLTNGDATSMDFTVMEDTAALTSITKSRVRGPKKKQRPTKSLAITTLDPFEVAAGSDRTEQNGTPEPPTPEPEIKPKPKKTYGKPMGMGMMGMGAMNNELMNKLGGRKKAGSPEPKPESSEPAAEPSEESSPAPKKSPYRPPGARAMPGMGFGMGGGIGSELAGKLKSRNKAVESEDKTGDSEEKPSPPVPKAKPKGGIPLFPKPDVSRPRSPGSLGARKTPETPEKPVLRTKSWGKQS